jgi:glutamate-ammonia-ligase adenylyltransferase
MTSRSPAPAAAIVAEALREQLGAAYAQFSAEEQAQHGALLSRVTSPGDVALDVRPRGDGRWTLTVCAADALGTLSIIAGLLTAARLDIEAADVFSVRVPAPPPPPARRAGSRRQRVAPDVTVSRVLDVFRVRPLAVVTDAVWERLRSDLPALLGQLAAGQGEAARDRVVEGVSDVLRAHAGAGERLWPVVIETANDVHGRGTALRIRGQDSTGFLFELANALALLGVNIVTAEVRTVGGESRDTFVISDAHGALIDDPARLAQIRAATALIKQFTSVLPFAPDPALALRQFSAFTRQLLVRPDWTSALTDLREGEVLHTLVEMMGASAFLWEDFLRMQHGNLFPVVGDVAALGERRDIEALRTDLRGSLAATEKPAAQRDALNAFKDREMFRIDLRHITGRVDFRAFADELTMLADVVVGGAAALAEAAVVRAHGRPVRADRAPCAWAVCALGKGGGRELGFASDIELLFVYEADGATDGVTPVPNARYFEEWVRAFLQTLVTRREGIFEVDLRLRPYGDAGPLASSEAGLAAYYVAGGPALQFERMALVKLRAIAGDAALGSRVERLRDAFVYSGAPLDIDEVRHLRARQARELVPHGAVSAKYSAGGAVDVEYWTQVRQIVTGARDPGVRVTSTLGALERMGARGHVDAALADEAVRTYAFLRRLIDALRVVRGHARDLTIPPAESREFAYLARRLESDSPATLTATIEERMAFARGLWERVTH